MTQPAFTTLIDAQSLKRLYAAQARLRVFDCRFDLQDAEAGMARFLDEGCFPDATYLHLDRDLSGAATPGKTGRHPLPNRYAFSRLLHQRGVQAATQVVAYDDSGGMFAARLWWLARWAGHARAAVLDGGYRAWIEAQGSDSVEAETPPADAASTRNSETPRAETPPSSQAPDGKPPTPLTMQDAQRSAINGEWTLLDARAADRFRGENETIDAKAGHIPGALNAPFQDNLDANGRFLPSAALRERFERLLAPAGGRPVACYCGSGVSAAHNILAMLHAGLPEPSLYPGSWSEWITHPRNPVATQARPAKR